jgi:MerR family mercuric resistance operon transcriptional regulator
MMKRLAFIRRSRGLGFTIEQVSELLRFVDEPDHTCGEVRGVAMRQARAAQEKIDDLKRLQKALNEMAARCKGGRYKVEDCPIIDALFEGADSPR